MTLTELLKHSLELLRSVKCRFAIGGGLAADLYRRQVRGTGDLDFLFLAEESDTSEAKEILKRLGLGTVEIRLHDLTRSPRMNKKSQEVYMLVGRKKKEDEPGVDLLLPPFPWFPKALDRAQSHLVNFGFGPTPTLTAEDLILAKIYAKRPKDIDDIISIFEAKYPLDLDYLAGEMERLKLILPEALMADAPIGLRTLSRRMRKKKNV